ncbi:uncharacterized protein LOC143882534 [Tasmannia lanceolata]|uniref:uncharacterized protein LOC143882534 n=1 Tax=Tasmannia lanceolata TaxID=3420 RepID=UPI004063DE01
MKTRGKNRLLLCFRPIGLEVEKKSNGKERSGDPLFTFFQENLILSASSKSENPEVEEEDVVVDHRRRKITSRIFSRVLKTVASENLATKDRSGKARKDSNRIQIRKHSDSPDEMPVPEISRESLPEDDRKTESVFSSSSFSRSMTSSSDASSSERKFTLLSDQRTRSLPVYSGTSNESNLQQTRRKTGETAIGNYNSATGLYLMLISLSVLLFWGRICAIIWTSTCLYFAPCLKTDVYSSETDESSPESTPKSPEIYSKEYKKRVIMKGLLERSNSRI